MRSLDPKYRFTEEDQIWTFCMGISVGITLTLVFTLWAHAVF